MCLIVDTKVKPKKPNKDGYCVGWKVIRATNLSLFWNYLYKKGIVEPKNLDRCFPRFCEVNEGLHLFLTRKDARLEISDTYWDNDKKTCSLKIIKVYYQPKDVIAYGKYTINLKHTGVVSSVAVKKLLVKSLKHAG